MARFGRIFGDRVVSFGSILVPISHPNKSPISIHLSGCPSHLSGGLVKVRLSMFLRAISYENYW
jgi:hypothetical protein